MMRARPPLLAIMIGVALAVSRPAARPEAAAPGPPPGARVLVMPFPVQVDSVAAAEGAGVAWLGEAAAILLAEDLDALGLQTVSRDERVGAFERLQLPSLSPLTRATTIRVGELLGASEIVIGEIHTGARLTIRARLIRLDRGEQLADVQQAGPTGEMSPVVERLASSIARATGRPLAAASPRPEQDPPLPPDVFESYVKGLIAVAPATRQKFLEAAYHGARRDGRVLVALWSVYTDEGDHAKALAAAKNVPSDAPLADKARFLAGLSLIELGRLNEAFKTLSDLQAEHPSPALSSALGVVQLRRGADADGPSATTLFRRAVDQAPEQTEYLFNLGYAYALAQDTSSALFWLRQAVRFDAADGAAHLVMSSLLASTGRSVEAKRELDLATLLGGGGGAAGAPPRQVPSGLERLPGALDEAAERRVLTNGNAMQREQQEVADFHLKEGRRLFEAKRDREAIDALRRAIYLSPYQDEPHLLLGRLYERAGRLPEATDEFKVAIWCRESVEARLALGTALLAAGEKAAARAQAERVLAMRPDSPEGKALLARTSR